MNFLSTLKKNNTSNKTNKLTNVKENRDEAFIVLHPQFIPSPPKLAHFCPFSKSLS